MKRKMREQKGMFPFMMKKTIKHMMMLVFAAFLFFVPVVNSNAAQTEEGTSDNPLAFDLAQHQNIFQ